MLSIFSAENDKSAGVATYIYKCKVVGRCCGICSGLAMGANNSVYLSGTVMTYVNSYECLHNGMYY